MRETRAIILAAGKGTRMKSQVPKVLHQVAGKPVLRYIVDVVRSLKTYVVVGHGAAQVKHAIGDSVEYVLQNKLLGTGDALRRVQPYLKSFSGTLLVLCGDTPLLEPTTVRRLMARHKQAKAAATVMTAIVRQPFGYGRIVRDAQGNFVAIREQKDAGPGEHKIHEINVGMYCFEAKAAFEALRKIKLNPKKKEYYLTDIIKLLLSCGKRVSTWTSLDESAAFGINTRQDLAQADGIIRRRILNQLMDSGVTIVDPATTYVESGCKIGTDTIIYPCTFIHRDVVIGRKCSIGPFARLRPGTRIGDATEIGNFTEVSRSRLGRQTVMKHFSFLGDAMVGNAVNIGAGAVTANYDGKDKNKTVISDGAFIGSDAVLVAPVTVGAKAVVGAGSVVKKGTRVPSGAVVVGVPARRIRG